MTTPPQASQAQLVTLVFQVIGAPLAFLLIGVFARRLGRRDGDDSPRRNDWAVATTVLLMTLGSVSGDLLEAIRRGDNAQNAAYWLIGLLCATFVSVERDRYTSWVLGADNKPSRLKRILGGIIFPDVVALLIFSAYQYMKLGKLTP